MNVQRPSPLKVNKDSHGLHKPSDQRHRRPVIIYTHSPKIIHTQARDFMALVQRLTGISSEPLPEISNDSSTVTAEETIDRRYNSADISLFTPNGVDVNLNSSLSPTLLEFMKGLPEY